MHRTASVSSVRLLSLGLALAGSALLAAAQGEAGVSISPVKNQTPAATAPAENPWLAQPIYTLPKKVSKLDGPLVSVTPVGSIKRINLGLVAPWEYTEFAPGSVAMGLGLGTATHMNAVGEMITFAGRTFVRSTDPEKPGVVEVRDAAFRTPNAAVVAADKVGQVFPRVYRYADAQPASLGSLLGQLANGADQPVIVQGWVEATGVEGTALKKAPTSGEKLTGEKRAEYVEPVKAEHASMVFVAVVMPRKERLSLKTSLLASAIFETLPVAPGAPSYTASAALVKEPALPSYMTSPIVKQALQNVTVTEVVHLDDTMTQAMVTRGLFEVHRINGR